MSVIVAKRKESMIEYVDNARKIAEIIPDRMENLLRKINNKYSNVKYISNRIFGYYYEMPIKLATDAYLYVTEANRLFTKNEKLLERRIIMNRYVDSCRTLEILQQDSGLLPKPRTDWNTFVPQVGDLAYVDEDDSEYEFTGSEWKKQVK